MLRHVVDSIANTFHINSAKLRITAKHTELQLFWCRKSRN